LISKETEVEWAVVAGASGAIGSHIVERMLNRGLRVVTVARDANGLQALPADDDLVRPCAADITSDEAVDLIWDALPGVCRAVVNAAAAPLGGDVSDVTPQAVLAAIDVKVNGTLRLVRAVDAALVTDSRVIALGGNLAYDPIPEAATAGVGNAALANLVKQLSRSLGSRGVTVHMVAPGPVWTERLRALLTDAAATRGVSEDVVLAEFEERSPIGHLVTIDEVGWAVETLLAPEARSLAGGTLLLDSGQRTGFP
jgi:NAD(P)-dependent dehydrogenase (short-subunit alcohol dehydrogenase family)